jgi:hypothetical protein
LQWAEWHFERIFSEDFSLPLQIIPSVIHVHFSLGAVTIGHHVLAYCMFWPFSAIIRYILLTFTFPSDLLDLPTLAIVYRMDVFMFSLHVLCTASLCVGELSIIQYDSLTKKNPNIPQ